ncbi:DJ-1 protein [Aureobasidium subglaciale]|nr:DJ-1 protein [Aureobasidium subglaciale]
MMAQDKQQLSALVFIADGSEEIETVTPLDVLVRAGFTTVKSVGVNLKNPLYAQCSRGIKIIPDIPSPNEIPDRLVDAADILILPGGAPGARTFCQSEEVLRLVREFRNEGKWVAAICAGTTALVESVKSPRADGEAAKKCRVTSHPSVKQEIVDAGWTYADDSERVVVDGKIITSRGPGTALLFSLIIVEQLAGKAKREEIQGPMICAETL